MDRNRKRQILKAEAYYARLDQLARDLAERGFYVLGGIQPGAAPPPPSEEAPPPFWKAPDSR
ncbi:MAG TPA: hypothetical protein VGE54_01185 [Brevundimonas sp.]